jgi:hypothetical protein
VADENLLSEILSGRKPEMEILADLGTSKVTLKPGEVVYLAVDWLELGGVRLRPESPMRIKIQLVKPGRFTNPE